jgi:two-component system, LuxR family, response regulator FixJ
METEGVVHLIDDDHAVRQSLAFLLTSAGLAVRLYESASAFLAVLDTVQPGCVVSDVRMPGIDGMQLQRRLQESGVRLAVIIMTGHAEVSLAVAAMKAGAVDFIEKPFDDETILAAIRAAMDYYKNAGRAETASRQIQERMSALSVREREVLEGLLAGRPNKTIAYDLGLSPRTIEVHRANVMTKMGAKSLSGLVRMSLAAVAATS